MGVSQGNKNNSLDIKDTDFVNKGNVHKLDIIVENMGRPKIGGGMNTARKGLNGLVDVDQKAVNNYKIYPMEFKADFIQKLKSLNGRALQSIKSPALYRTELDISGQPSDTFLRLDNWVKGVVFINGFNIGRYYNIGPQHTLYVPAPLLKSGKNDVFVFELHSHSNDIQFTDKPDLGK